MEDSVLDVLSATCFFGKCSVVQSECMLLEPARGLFAWL